MGKSGGFMEYDRVDPGYRPKEERIADWKAVEKQLNPEQIHEQAARCMNCGVPFCHGTGCPLGNLIPDFNDAVYRGEWEKALDILLSTSNFPEFTSRICPALCEASCTLELSDGKPVTVRQIELSIIEEGYKQGLMGPRRPESRTKYQAAVIGAGPAGLAVADSLNQMGHNVTVFDRAPSPGGILRYGIPEFKLEKWVVDRRIELMKKEGIKFECGVTVGADISYKFIEDRFDAVCLTGGSRIPRDLAIPGRDLGGIHFAMEFLMQQNSRLEKRGDIAESDISAKNCDVVVIGGGDTGSDCVGTSHRQGAKSVTQIEIMPEPPKDRSSTTPWPLWPLKLRTSSSHKEGGRRMWSISATKFLGENGQIKAVNCVEVQAEEKDGRLSFIPCEGSEFELKADLVLLALGFTGPASNKLLQDIGAIRDPGGNVQVDEQHMTSVRGVFSAGDMATGQSLVVRAIADGRSAAEDIDRYLLAGTSNE